MLYCVERLYSHSLLITYNRKIPVELKHCEMSSYYRIILSDETKTSEGRIILASHENQLGGSENRPKCCKPQLRLGFT